MNQINHDDLKDRIRKSGDFTAVQKRYLERAIDSFKHAYWDEAGAFRTCSNCMHTKIIPCQVSLVNCITPAYCRNCGARMDGGKENGKV